MKPNHPPKLSAIVAAVEAEFDLPAGTLYSPSRSPRICFVRQVAWWLIRDLTPASLPDIGTHFNGMHHTTILHGVAKIDFLMGGDNDLCAIVSRIKTAILDARKPQNALKWSGRL